MFKKYRSMLNDALDTVDEEILKNVFNTIVDSALYKKPILVIGNGGSAAIAEHWSCDHTKGIKSDVPDMFPSVRNLAANMSLMTAIANDMSYDEVFSKQIEYESSPYATVVAISSSGNSPNILKGLEMATKKNYNTIAFIGFDGGKILQDKLANKIIHVNANNYGIVEDCHQIIMHSLAQQIRIIFTEKDRDDLKL
jgi:D-sedoheptulose 7-phosphate isomerase